MRKLCVNSSIFFSILVGLLDDWNMLGKCTLEELQSIACSAVGVDARFFWLSRAVSHHCTEWNEDTITAALDRSKTFEIAMPPFIPVNDGQMALERMLNLADVHAECKRQGTVSQVDNEREDLVCSNDAFVVAISSIHGLTPHDANTLQQGIGSIEEIMAASKEDILDNTDLSAEKADAVVKFFHDPPFYMNPVPPSTRN
ncbi:hypothetical protein KP509_22G036300 [Ceratopteris richardii]|uniref:Uncharacterized protein n=1 Tax=Ceratopteris richardii TaxID=49495 RepID=A0A8T2S405_CERRI|nr:hypothetical protein KP509_22G036300 [Ceratopteris richardii]